MSRGSRSARPTRVLVKKQESIPALAIRQVLEEELTASRWSPRGMHFDTDVEMFIARQCGTGTLQAHIVPLEALHDWRREPGTGNVVHQTGRFFSVLGLDVLQRSGLQEPPGISRSSSNPRLASSAFWPNGSAGSCISAFRRKRNPATSAAYNSRRPSRQPSATTPVLIGNQSPPFFGSSPRRLRKPSFSPDSDGRRQQVPLQVQQEHDRTCGRGYSRRPSRPFHLADPEPDRRSAAPQQPGQRLRPERSLRPGLPRLIPAAPAAKQPVAGTMMAKSDTIRGTLQWAR